MTEEKQVWRETPDETWLSQFIIKRWLKFRGHTFNSICNICLHTAMCLCDSFNLNHWFFMTFPNVSELRSLWPRKVILIKKGESNNFSSNHNNICYSHLYLTTFPHNSGKYIGKRCFTEPKPYCSLALSGSLLLFLIISQVKKVTLSCKSSLAV